MSGDHKYISRKPDGKGGWRYVYELAKPSAGETERLALHRAIKRATKLLADLSANRTDDWQAVDRAISRAESIGYYGTKEERETAYSLRREFSHARDAGAEVRRNERESAIAELQRKKREENAGLTQYERDLRVMALQHKSRSEKSERCDAIGELDALLKGEKRREPPHATLVVNGTPLKVLELSFSEPEAELQKARAAAAKRLHASVERDGLIKSGSTTRCPLHGQDPLATNLVHARGVCLCK